MNRKQGNIIPKRADNRIKSLEIQITFVAQMHLGAFVSLILVLDFVYLSGKAAQRKGNFLMTKFIGKLAADRGASAVEYAILVGLIAVAVIAGALLLGPTIGSVFGGVASQLPTA